MKAHDLEQEAVAKGSTFRRLTPVTALARQRPGGKARKTKPDCTKLNGQTRGAGKEISPAEIVEGVRDYDSKRRQGVARYRAATQQPRQTSQCSPERPSTCVPYPFAQTFPTT